MEDKVSQLRPFSDELVTHHCDHCVRAADDLLAAKSVLALT
jgi:hypothetical protein